MLDMMDILYEALGGLKNIPHELREEQRQEEMQHQQLTLKLEKYPDLRKAFGDYHGTLRATREWERLVYFKRGFKAAFKLALESSGINYEEEFKERGIIPWDNPLVD